jgi:hypothetical protein
MKLVEGAATALRGFGNKETAQKWEHDKSRKQTWRM